MNTLNRLRVVCSNRSLLFSLCIAIAFIASCSANHGRLVYNANVKKAFETYQLPPNHAYYYSGPDARPNAVIGIQKEYLLKSRFWKPVELTPNLLKEWLERGRRPRDGYDLSNNGSDIIAPDGRQIGIWYSVRNWKDWATVEMIDDKTFIVSTPIETKSRGKRDRDKD
jgi:hypothetical protein